MTFRMTKLNAVLAGSVVGLALSVSQVSAQSIVPTDFAIAEPEQAPVAVIAPLPPNRLTTTTTARPARRVAAATPRVASPSSNRVAYVDQDGLRPVSISWPLANRPNFLWIGAVY